MILGMFEINFLERQGMCRRKEYGNQLGFRMIFISVQWFFNKSARNLAFAECSAWMFLRWCHCVYDNTSDLFFSDGIVNFFHGDVQWCRVCTDENVWFLLCSIVCLFTSSDLELWPSLHFVSIYWQCVHFAVHICNRNLHQNWWKLFSLVLDTASAVWHQNQCVTFSTKTLTSSKLSLFHGSCLAFW